MKFKILTLTILSFLLLGGNSTNAQVQKRAQVGFRFLENMTNPAVVGRGGFGIARLHNSSAIFYNPAGLSWVSGTFDAQVDYVKGIADINQATASVAWNLNQYGVVALSANVMEYGDFYGTQRSYTAPKGYIETGVFSPEANAFGAAYSKRVSDRFSFGVHGKLAHQYLGSPVFEDEDSTKVKRKYELTVPALDVGAYYDFKNGITFGAAFDNVSKEVRYVEEQFPLPFAMKFGMTFEPMQFLELDMPGNEILFGVESYHGRDFKGRIKTGAELQYLNTFIVRAGYMFNYSERGLTMGFGLTKAGFRFDYAYQDFGLFNGIHLVAVGFSL